MASLAWVEASSYRRKQHAEKSRSYGRYKRSECADWCYGQTCAGRRRESELGRQENKVPVYNQRCLPDLVDAAMSQSLSLQLEGERNVS